MANVLFATQQSTAPENVNMPGVLPPTFAAAADKVRASQKEMEGSILEYRKRSQDLKVMASCLSDRPIHRLKRLRLEADAADSDAQAEALDRRMSMTETSIATYAKVFIGISSASAACDARDIKTSAAGESTSTVDLPPGSVAAAAPDGGINFQNLFEHRGVSSAKENLCSEMLQEITGEVSKPKMHNSTRCADCDRDLVLSTVKALLVCPGCGAAQPHLDATPSCVAYDEGGRREMYASFSYTYRRCNHLCERIAQIQATSAAVVTDKLLQEVCAELYKERRSMDEITAPLVKDVLKKLKKRKAYEYVVLITLRLQGQPPIKFTRETTEKIRRMFEAVQRPFERHCPKSRANFLSYGYIIFKFLELLGAHSLLPYMPLLKGRTKMQKQDAIWRKICEDPEVNWEFIPSV